MSERYLTIPKIAQRLNISDNTVRRYIKRYPQFFQKTMIDRWEQYPEDETLRLVKRISEVSESGKRRSEVLAVLENEFEAVAPEPARGGSGEPVMSEDAEFLSQFATMLAENDSFINQMAKVLAKNQPFLNRLNRELEAQ